MTDRLQYLSNVWCDGIATANEQAELEQLVQQDPSAAKIFVHQVDQHHALLDVLEASGEIVVAPTTSRKRRSANRRISMPARRAPWRTLVGAVAASVAVVVVLLATLGQEHDKTVWVQIADQDEHAVVVTDRLAVSGATRVRFSDGSQFLFSDEAEASVRISSGIYTFLTRGVLTAKVEPQPSAAPCLIDTPLAHYRVVGTEFSVSERAGISDLVVTKGIVAVRRGTAEESLVHAGRQHRVVSDELVGEQTAIGDNTQWYYYDKVTPPPSDWFADTFDASTWKHGRAPLGFDAKGRDLLQTKISSVGSRADGNLTIWLRTSFSLVGQPRSARIHVKFDDGFVLYLNGREVTRQSMPSGPDEGHVAALPGNRGSKKAISLSLPVDGMRTGQNTIAVSLHQEEAGEGRQDGHWNMQLWITYDGDTK